MKDLGVAKQILGMRIIRGKANGTLKLSLVEPVSTPLGSYFRLSKEQLLKKKKKGII